MPNLVEDRAVPFIGYKQSPVIALRGWPCSIRGAISETPIKHGAPKVMSE